MDYTKSNLQSEAPEAGPESGATNDGPEDLQAQLLLLKQQQAYQQQLLVAQFHQQQQHLASQHNQQIQYHLQSHEWEKQKEVEEKLERDAGKIEMLKNKKKNEESANASTEVKQLLAEFVLKKRQQEKICGQPIPNTGTPPKMAQWASAHHSSIEQSSPPTNNNMSPPFNPKLIRGYDGDFPPLRKAASEPNLKIKSVLKQKVIERRSSPLLKRKDKSQLLKRKTPLTVDTTLANSSPESGPNSPLMNLHHGVHDAALTCNTQFEGRIPPIPIAHADLYTSPSMPNISLGKPLGAFPVNEMDHLVSEGKPGLMMVPPTMGNPGLIPYFTPSLPVIDGEGTPPSSPAYITLPPKKAHALSHGASFSPPGPHGGATDSPPGPINKRINRNRPLVRTHSAPLPLGTPLFTQQQYLLQQQQQQEQYLKEQSTIYVKQHVRQTVLQRVGNKSQMENVDEETETKLAQELKRIRENNDRLLNVTDEDPAMNQEDDIILSRDSRATEAHDPENLSRAVTVSEMNRHDRQSFLRFHRDKLLHQQTEVSVSGRPLPPRTLARTHSSPLVMHGLSSGRESPVKYKFGTGLAFDPLMLKHQCVCGSNNSHPEHAGRLQSIWARLQEAKLVDKCERVKSRKATIEELQSCHSEPYSLFYGTNLHNRQKLDQKLVESLPVRFLVMPCGGVGTDSDTVWNEVHTSHAARMAAGCVTELAIRVAQHELKNGFALVRPPGHHAEINQPMGFCYFNSIAIAARQLQKRTKTERVLIVDWDVHHGNGTQQMFYTDPNVMYISLHRHDFGNFFPGTGSIVEVGEGEAIGTNINIAWSSAQGVPMGDAEYLAAFRSVVMPVSALFQPEVILVSAGFDGAFGHIPQLGGYRLSPACFGWMTSQLMTLAGGKIVLALEGGYDLPAICDCSEMCVKALLGEEYAAISDEELSRSPCKEAIDVLTTVLHTQAEYRPSLRRAMSTVQYSYNEALRVSDTVDALASMSMTSNLSRMGSSMDSEPMEES